jgi:hypothetical protein
MLVLFMLGLLCILFKVLNELHLTLVLLTNVNDS